MVRPFLCWLAAVRPARRSRIDTRLGARSTRREREPPLVRLRRVASASRIAGTSPNLAVRGAARSATSPLPLELRYRRPACAAERVAHRVGRQDLDYGLLLRCWRARRLRRLLEVRWRRRVVAARVFSGRRNHTRRMATRRAWPKTATPLAPSRLTTVVTLVGRD